MSTISNSTAGRTTTDCEGGKFKTLLRGWNCSSWSSSTAWVVGGGLLAPVRRGYVGCVHCAGSLRVQPVGCVSRADHASGVQTPLQPGGKRRSKVERRPTSAVVFVISASSLIVQSHILTKQSKLRRRATRVSTRPFVRVGTNGVPFLVWSFCGVCVFGMVQ